MSANCTELFSTNLTRLALCETLVATIGAANDETLSVFKADTTNFMLVWGAALVIFMHAGFAMLSAGAIRGKNAKNILLCITLDLCLCAIAWYLCGFAFAYGDDKNLFIGSTYFVGTDVGAPGKYTYAFWVFQYAFAATSATIVSGAIAERARFESYLGYSFFFSGWVYPVVAHWVWGGGFLTIGKSTSIQETGVLDFAGDGPVHMIGGIAGMLACYLIGPRTGRFDPETGKPVFMPGHSSSLQNLGTFILWIGWLGFNPGSILLLSGNGTVMARCAVNTMLSSSTACITALLFGKLLTARTYDLQVALNGALGGLVGITGSCAAVELWAAIAIGFISGIVYVLGSALMLKLKLDDPLDATPVHFFCGVWGLLAGGFLANPVLFYSLGAFSDNIERGGLVYGVGGRLMIAQLVEIAVIIAWTVGWMTPIFLLLKRKGYLRVSPGVEEEGLDSSAHGGAAYPDAAKKKVGGRLEGY